MKRQKIAVLIPCYNEAATIGKVVKDFKKSLPEAEVYVYDNNSTDDTVKIAKKNGATVKREIRQGKGNVVRTMFRDIDADAYILVDGDDTYPADAAKDLIKPILDDNVDMVIGDRLSSTYFAENKRFGHNIGNKLVRKLINTTFRANIQDIMTGYRAFSYDFVKTFPILSKGFEIETEMTIHALDKNLNLVELPVQYRDRPQGSYSKLNTIPDGIRVIKTFFNLVREYKPLFFFSTVAALLLLIALILGTSIVIEFIQTGLVPRLPTFILSAILVVAALLSFMTGLILDSIARKGRQYFELKLNEITQQKNNWEQHAKAIKK